MKLEYRQQVTVIGAIIGAAVGSLVALFWLDRATHSEKTTKKLVRMQAGDMARIGTAVFALARQIYELAEEKPS
jgi:gas vesicle protein